MAFEAFSIGSEALKTAMGALSVVGHNISNVNTEGYTRQRANLDINPPLNVYPGQKGTGVHLASITRLTDEFTRLQTEIENEKLGQTSIKSNLLQQMEQIFNDPEAKGLQDAMTEFFNAFSDLANAPEDYPARQVVIQKGLALTEKMHFLSKEFQKLQNDINAAIGIKVEDVNSMLTQIAKLNKEISFAEAEPTQHANDLRDSRELLVKQLHKIMGIREMEDDSKCLFIETTDGTVLVAGTNAHYLTTTTDSDGNTILAEAMTGKSVTLTTGELKGYMDIRDETITGLRDELDTLAVSLIEEVNRIHSRGTPLNPFTEVSGTTMIENTTFSLANLNLTFPPKNGSFYLSVYDKTTHELIEEAEISVNSQTDTMQDIIDRVNTSLTHVSAGINSGNYLEFTADTGYDFHFVKESTGEADSADFLMSMGINTFFSGDSAFTINVDNRIQEDANLIAAGRSRSAGDNTTALEIFDLQNQNVLSEDTATFVNYYSNLVSEVGINSETAQNDESTHESLMNLLEQRLKSTTGVSLDEEATNLLTYQRMYQAAAKYIQVMDSVFEILITGL